MQPAVLIRLRPAGPWRFGPGNGGQDRVDAQYRSDRLYSAVTLAMKQLGWLDEWLEATAKAAGSSVAFTSLFPYQGQTLFVPPPTSLWPPPPGLLTTPSPVFLSKIRWNAVNFVPAALVETILLGQPVLADQWLPDPESACLLRRDRLNATPFRTVLRSGAAVDRLTSRSTNVHASACVEFEPGSGLWTIVRFQGEAAQSDWGQRIAAAFRLLADQGFGGKRTSGWGQTEPPQFQEGTWPGLLLPKLARALAKAQPDDSNAEAPDTPQHWLLSLFSPAESDQIDWSSGEYRVVVRGGYVHGAPLVKKHVRLIAEGSVLASSQADLTGVAVDVAPDGHAHPVYRSGIALSLRLPVIPATPPEAAKAELEQILNELEVAAAEQEPAAHIREEEPPAEAEPTGEEPAFEHPGSEESASEEPAAEEPAVTPETVIDQPVSEPAVEPSSPQEPNPPGSPELEGGRTTSEVEPQNGSESLGSIEDPETSAGEGPDHGL